MHALDTGQLPYKEDLDKVEDPLKEKEANADFRSIIAQ